LLRRAVRLLVSPAREWAAIAADGESWRTVALRHVIPLSALLAVAWMLGRLAFPADLATWESTPLERVPQAVVRGGAAAFCGSVLWVVLLAAAFCAFAPMFGARRDWAQSWKVAAYGTTPVWLAGVLLLKPLLVGFLLIPMLHCTYLYYAGLQAVAGVKQGEAAEYVGLVLFLALVGSTLLGGMLAGIDGP
jgi:Yip1 domain